MTFPRLLADPPPPKAEAVAAALARGSRRRLRSLLAFLADAVGAKDLAAGAGDPDTMIPVRAHTALADQRADAGWRRADRFEGIDARDLHLDPRAGMPIEAAERPPC